MKEEILINATRAKSAPRWSKAACCKKC